MCVGSGAVTVKWQRPMRSNEGLGFAPGSNADMKRATRQRGSSGALPGGTETILIVDDEPAVVNVIKRMIEPLGYTTLSAPNGREAVELAKTYEGEIHLAILDMTMPVMDGAKAFPLLREARPEMKIIVISAYGLDRSSQALLDAGASAFIPKPFRRAELAAGIRRALDADKNLPS